MVQTWQKTVAKSGGKIISERDYSCRVFYDYQAEWETNEQVDQFVNSFPKGTLKCERAMVDGNVVVYFSVVPQGERCC